MKISNVTVYALVNPLNSSVFYVGCTKSICSRWKGHWNNKNKKTRNYKIIDEIRNSGKTLKIIKLTTVDMSDATFWENFYITLFKSFGNILTNKQTSTYTAINANRYIIKSKNVTIPITANTIESIEKLSYDMGMKTDLIIKLALKEFIEKYTPLYLKNIEDTMGMFNLRQTLYDKDPKKI